MEILETLLTLVVTIVFIKFCLWFAETVEQECEDTRALREDRRRRAQPRSTKKAPTNASASRVKRTFASTSTQTDGAQYKDLGSQTNITGTDITKLQAQAAATKWQAIVVRTQRTDVQKLEQEVREEAADLDQRRQGYKKRINKLVVDLRHSETLRKDLDIASDIQHQRADAAEDRLRRHVEAAAAAASTRTHTTRRTGTQTDDAVSTKAAEDRLAIQSRIDELQLALSTAEQERDAERSRADLERKRADEHEEKIKSGTPTLAELETARKAQSDAEAKCKEAEQKLGETELAAEADEHARNAAKTRADDLQVKLDEARNTIKENRKTAKDSTDNAAREKQQPTKQLEDIGKERDAAVAERSQGTNTGDQATPEHSNVVKERDAAVTKQNQALEQVQSMSKERDEANRTVARAKTDWEKMLGERDQALRNQEAAVATANAAESRQKEFWDEGCRIFQLLMNAEAREQEINHSAQQAREQLNNANIEIEQLKQVVERLDHGLQATQNGQVNGNGGFQQMQAMDVQLPQSSATQPFASTLPPTMSFTFGSGQQSQQLPHIPEVAMPNLQSQPTPPNAAPVFQFGAPMPEGPMPYPQSQAMPPSVAPVYQFGVPMPNASKQDAQAMMKQVGAEERARNEASQQQPQPNHPDVDMESAVTAEPSKGPTPSPQNCPDCHRRMSNGNCMRLGCGAAPGYQSGAPELDTSKQAR